MRLIIDLGQCVLFLFTKTIFLVCRGSENITYPFHNKI